MPSMTDEQAAAYIAGFIDGEGHIGCHKTARGHWQRSIGLCNTDKFLIERVAYLLTQLGFVSRITHDRQQRENWSDRWTLYIAGGRPAFERFRTIIPIQAPAKVEAINRFFELYDEADRAKTHRQVAASTPCETCGKPVRVSPAQRKRGDGRFCSVECRGIEQRKRIEKPCETCGNPFVVIAARRDTARFCSLSCFGKSKADRMRGMATLAAKARWNANA